MAFNCARLLRKRRRKAGTRIIFDLGGAVKVEILKGLKDCGFAASRGGAYHGRQQGVTLMDDQPIFTFFLRRGLALRGIHRACVVIAIVLAVAVSASAQERFELDDQSYEWEKQTQYDPASPEGKLQQIRKTLAEGKAKNAEKLLDDWIEDYPNHPRLVEAYLLRGDAKSERKHYYRALFDYEHVITYYPASEQYTTALQREYDIAKRFATGTRRRMWGIRFVTAYGEAEEIFIRTQERTPGSYLGEKASLELGDFYYRRGEMSAAAEAYDLFLINYPQSASREQVMLRLIYASLARFKGPRYDTSGLIDAKQQIAQYQREYPAAAEKIGAQALLNRVDESLALKQLYSAEWYDRVGQDISAIYMYRRVIDEHPDTPASQKAISRLEQMGEPIVAGAAEAPAAEPTAEPAVEEGTEAEVEQ